MEIFDEQEKISLVIDGIEKEYDILFSFDCEENGRTYIGCTDHSLTDAGEEVMRVGYYVKEGDHNLLMPLETQDEQDMVDDVLKQIRVG